MADDEGGQDQGAAPKAKRPVERRVFSLREAAKRWVTDWTALIGCSAAVITVAQGANVPFPLVWASEFHQYKTDEGRQIADVKVSLLGLQLSVEQQTQQELQRELRARQADKQTLADQHRPVPDYLENIVADLQTQLRSKQDEIASLRQRISQQTPQ